MQIRDLRYNERLRAFEASVDVVQNDRRLRFPLTVFGPTSLSPKIINANLYRQAAHKAATH
ncbi:MAG: orotidine 5'-phosphate decarboxylase [Yoonia sp.]|uniref:orotidine 5'-phosphate decarboxylase n=1 Tax=Yoonia sp. TaxID=2212373 RepID=UPI00220AD657|nr:orotidine 5'-phosphate decarboxylase [Rhodobacteraceae bacterium S2214]